MSCILWDTNQSLGNSPINAHDVVNRGMGGTLTLLKKIRAFVK